MGVPSPWGRRAELYSRGFVGRAEKQHMERLMIIVLVQTFFYFMDVRHVLVRSASPVKTPWLLLCRIWYVSVVC